MPSCVIFLSLSSFPSQSKPKLPAVQSCASMSRGAISFQSKANKLLQSTTQVLINIQPFAFESSPVYRSFPSICETCNPLCSKTGKLLFVGDQLQLLVGDKHGGPEVEGQAAACWFRHDVCTWLFAHDIMQHLIVDVAPGTRWRAAGLFRRVNIELVLCRRGPGANSPINSRGSYFLVCHCPAAISTPNIWSLCFAT